jgi:hypothetical protein
LGSDAPPFGIARLDNAGDHYPFSMEFFPTARGLEEYATAKALDAAGLRQNVSIGFSIEETGPVPDSLRKLGVRRYITRGKFLELSLVGVGAIPGAQIERMKCHGCGNTAGSSCGCGRKSIEPAPRPSDLQQWIPSSGQEEIAHRAIAVALRRWGIKSRPTLHFFKPNGINSGSVLLDRNPPEVWVEAGLDDEQTGLAALHECWHLREREHFEPTNEIAAENLARRLLPEIGDPALAKLNGLAS